MAIVDKTQRQVGPSGWNNLLEPPSGCAIVAARQQHAPPTGAEYAQKLEEESRFLNAMSLKYRERHNVAAT